MQPTGEQPPRGVLLAASWIQFCTQVKMLFQNQKNDAEFCKASNRVSLDTEIQR